MNICTGMGHALKLVAFHSFPKFKGLRESKKVFVCILVNPANIFIGMELAKKAAPLHSFQKLREGLNLEISVGILANQPSIYTGMDLV